MRSGRSLGRSRGAEWEQVRMHPYHSERILATSSALEPMARVAGMHHERLDGSGYHRGCRARELSHAARIVAAADAFQAMTQERPHRTALSAEQAGRGAAARRPRRAPRRGCRRGGPRGGRRSARPPPRQPAAGRAQRARDRGPTSRRCGLLQPGDRHAARHLPSHGGAPRAAHLREGGRVQPSRPRALCSRARPHLRSGERLSPRRERWADLPMRGRCPGAKVARHATGNPGGPP